MLSPEDINAIEDWVSRIEDVGRQIERAAQTMYDSSNHNQEAGNKMIRAANNMPHTIYTRPG